MNLIDKILGILKKRGANVPPVEPATQVPHAPKNRVKKILTGVAVLVLASAAGTGGWLWWNSRQKAAVPVKVAQAPTKPISAPQVVSPPVALPNEASGVVMTQPLAESQPVEAVTQEVAPKENGPKESGHETETATLSPGPELETPPQDKVRNKHPATASRHRHKKTVSIPEYDTKSREQEDEPDATAVPEGGVDKKVKPLSLQQQADNEFRKANGLMQQGRTNEAIAGYEAALQLDPGHDAARQALVVLLLQNNRNGDAERVLQDGLKHNIKHSGFAMLLARIQLDRDASWSALLTLQKTLPYAERQGDYQAFVAALLQRLNRHKEAVMHYQAAVQIAPNSGVWWMGLGISLKALQRNDEARVAFQHALDTHTLNDDLKSFVSQQLKGL